MTWSADDEYRTQILARRGVVLRLRAPALAYGPAALTLMFAAGLMAGLWLAAGATSLGAGEAATLAIPAAAATLACAAVLGARLGRNGESGAVTLIVRAALIWAIVGAGWTMLTSNLGAFSGETVLLLRGQVIELGLRALAGGAIAGVAGTVGAAVATVLCIERRD